MGIPFYDNRLDAIGAWVVGVERVYCFDWRRFGRPEWDELDRIYRRLPGAVQYLDVPFWFGSSDQSPPYLWASVEPSGLQVCGFLAESDWVRWDDQFRAEAERLPTLRPSDEARNGDA
jgi:hypothetical protein